MLEAYKTCDCCKHLIIDISFVVKGICLFLMRMIMDVLIGN